LPAVGIFSILTIDWPITYMRFGRTSLQWGGIHSFAGQAGRLPRGSDDMARTWRIDLVKRILLAIVGCCLLAGSTGCCGVAHRLLCCPLGPGTQCDPTHCVDGCGLVGGGMACGCGPTCGPTCGPVGEPCAPAACEPCGAMPCDTCGPVGACEPACGMDCGCGGCGHGAGLLGLFGGIYRALHPPGWCGGCGEIYWSEFHSDPPDCCDPCDCYGNFTGGGCTTCGPVGCGPTTCGPAGCGVMAENSAPNTLPREEYVSRLKPPVEPAPKVTRLAQPPKATKR